MLYSLLALVTATQFLACLHPPNSEATEPGTADTLFATADQCMACHNGLVTSAGEDISFGQNWRASMMANSARDPYWQAAVRREVLDHPVAQSAIEDKCASCHMPMNRFQAKVKGQSGQVFGHLPLSRDNQNSVGLVADGVSCTMCHQILEEALGEPESFTAGFSVDRDTPYGERQVFGTYKVDSGRARIMQSASQFRPVEAAHIQSSEFCATCHTLFTHAFGANGELVGELPEQVPYLEWQHSAYRESRSCQSCHMREVGEEIRISSVLGELRRGVSQHSFRGGNFLMPRLLNRYRDELGTVALPQELDRTSLQTVEHLRGETARIRIGEFTVAGDRLELLVEVENLAGHKLPTAYPSRRTWIRLIVKDKDGEPLFESGRFNGDGSIQGNDNDLDPTRFEPHYQRIDGPEKVQIYEVIMVDYRDVVTTGLLWGVRYIKDNRLLPAGFDKSTAEGDIAVWGEAARDADFAAGGDRVRYSVPLQGFQGPYSVEVELYYQPIAFRWAKNLRQQPSVETDRFVGYYESLAASSAVVLATAEKSVN